MRYLRKPTMKVRTSLGSVFVLVLTAAVLALLIGARSGGAVSASPSAAKGLLNGSFELPDIPTQSWKVVSTMPGWKVRGGVEIQDHWDAGQLWEAFGGDQYLELDGYQPSSVYQSVATKSKRTCKLRFAFSARPKTPATDNVLEVLWNGKRLALLNADGTGIEIPSWKTYSYTVTAKSRTSLVEFADRGLENGLGTLLDAVSLTGKCLR